MNVFCEHWEYASYIFSQGLKIRKKSESAVLFSQGNNFYCIKIHPTFANQMMETSHDIPVLLMKNIIYSFFQD